MNLFLCCNISTILTYTNRSNYGRRESQYHYKIHCHSPCFWGAFALFTFYFSFYPACSLPFQRKHVDGRIPQDTQNCGHGFCEVYFVDVCNFFIHFKMLISREMELRSSVYLDVKKCIEISQGADIIIWLIGSWSAIVVSIRGDHTCTWMKPAACKLLVICTSSRMTWMLMSMANYQQIINNCVWYYGKYVR